MGRSRGIVKAMISLPHSFRSVVAVVSGSLVVGSLTLAPAAQAAVGDASVFSMGANAAPQDVVAGPDGNLWVTNPGSNTIARVSTAGNVLQNYSLPTANSGVRNIAVGPDNNLWFTMTTSNQIGRITTAGVISTFNIPTANSQPYDIAAGPDGALWFTEFAGNKIGRITTDGGTINEYVLPSGNTGPWGITNGPTGSSRVYFTASGNGSVGLLTMAGSFSVVNTSNTGSSPRGILVNQGNVWFTMFGLSSIGNLVTDTQIASSSIGQQASYMALGPSNTMWLTTASNQVMQLSDRGAVVGTYSLPVANAQPAGIALGPDQNIWVALPGANSIARVSTGATASNTAAPTISPITGLAVGTMLTSTTGTWSVSGGTITYQWQRCSTTTTTSCANIPGATSSTYTITSADVGQFLRSGVSAVTSSGTSSPAYSAVVAGPTAGPGPRPTPTPTPTPGGNTASIGSGATMELDAPAKQKRTKRKTYDVIFSATDVQGTITLLFRSGSNRKSFTNLPIRDGVVEFGWKVPRRWPLNTTTVVATFVPVTGSKYTAAQATDTVRIRN
jgi:streptogramin lyase